MERSLRPARVSEVRSSAEARAQRTVVVRIRRGSSTRRVYQLAAGAHPLADCISMGIYMLLDEDSSKNRRAGGPDDDARWRYDRFTRLGRRARAAESERLEDLVRAFHGKSGMSSRKA